MAGVGDVPLYDQRGMPYQRVADGDVAETIVIDIGAYESQGTPKSPPGDYNRNGVADAVRLHRVVRYAWPSRVLPHRSSGADGDGDGYGDPGTDYDVWKELLRSDVPRARCGGVRRYRPH